MSLQVLWNFSQCYPICFFFSSRRRHTRSSSDWSSDVCSSDLIDATVRLANLKSGGLDLIERLLATDIKDVQADKRLKLSSAIELGYQGVTLNIGKDKAKGPLSQSAKVRQALALSRARAATN